jgi:hypothetical protein
MRRDDAYFHSIKLRKFQRPSPLAIILGTNEIASAIAVFLRRSGRSVVLAHDPGVPVIRRGMAFHDALFGDFAWVDDFRAKRADYISNLFSLFEDDSLVAVTEMGLTDLMAAGKAEILVDARMHKRSVRPDLRGLAGVSFGVGPGFIPRHNCDIAIETRPDLAGLIVLEGRTEPQDQSMPSLLGGKGRERFIYASNAGRWRTALDIGVRVFKGVVIGHLDGGALAAPMDGVLRGLARDDCDIPAGAKIVEIDPRGRACRWSGMDQRCETIAQAVMRATRLKEAELAFFEQEPSNLRH